MYCAQMGMECVGGSPNREELRDDCVIANPKPSPKCYTDVLEFTSDALCEVRVEEKGGWGKRGEPISNRSFCFFVHFVCSAELARGEASSTMTLWLLTHASMTEKRSPTPVYL